MQLIESSQEPSEVVRSLFPLLEYKTEKQGI